MFCWQFDGSRAASSPKAKLIDMMLPSSFSFSSFTFSNWHKTAAFTLSRTADLWQHWPLPQLARWCQIWPVNPTETRSRKPMVVRTMFHWRLPVMDLLDRLVQTIKTEPRLTFGWPPSCYDCRVTPLGQPTVTQRLQRSTLRNRSVLITGDANQVVNSAQLCIDSGLGADRWRQSRAS